MDLDEMKQQWEEQNQKLDESIRLSRSLLTATNLNHARSALQRLKAALIFGAAIWFLIIMALGDFIFQNLANLGLVWSAVAVDVFAIGMLVANIRQLATIQKIDYASPVVLIQRRLAELRVFRVRTVQWGLVAGTIVWAPCLIVVAKAWFGLEGINAAWLWANVVFGLSLIPLTIWISRRFADRMHQSPFLQKLMRDIAGQNLTAATGFLASISEFERE
jgi:hypothetical protein